MADQKRPPIRVLIVDEEADIRGSYRQSLRRFGTNPAKKCD